METKNQFMDYTKFVSLIDYLQFRDIDSGVIIINGDIRQSVVAYTLCQLREIKRRNLPKITMILNSFGGELYSSFALYDALRDLSKSGTEVTILVEGLAASAAAMILLQAADIRASMPSARFLLHEIRRVAAGTESTSELKDEVTEIDKLSNMIINVLSKRCGKTKKEIKKMFERKDVWLSANEAKDWGLIDRVI